MMYQHLTYRSFIEMLQRLCWEHKTGFIFFSTEDDAWGKIKLHRGLITGLGYNSVWGAKALPLVRRIDQVKCFFQQKPAADDGQPPPRDHSLPDTDEILSLLLAEEVATAAVKAHIEEELATVEREEAAQKPARRPGQRSILVADDSRVGRMMLVKPLELAGYQVIAARDGYEAIGLAEATPPDLFIVDVHMPGIDGHKVLDVVRRNPRLKHTPFFLVAGKDGLFDRLKGRMADCEAYLQKPLDISEVLKLVREHLYVSPA